MAPSNTAQFFETYIPPQRSEPNESGPESPGAPEAPEAPETQFNPSPGAARDGLDEIRYQTYGPTEPGAPQAPELNINNILKLFTDESGFRDDNKSGDPQPGRTINEVGADGSRLTWGERDGNWTSADRPGEVRTEMSLGKNGVLSYVEGDRRHHVLPGGGDLIEKAGDSSRFQFDDDGRLRSIAYDNGDVRSVVYAPGGNRIDGMSYTVAKTGQTYEYTRIGDQEKFSFRQTDSRGRLLKTGVWNGSIESFGEGMFGVLDGNGNGRKPSGFWQKVPPDGGTYMERKNSDGSTLICDSQFAIKSLLRPDNSKVDCHRENGQLTQISERRPNGDTINFNYDPATKLWTSDNPLIEPSASSPLDKNGNLKFQTADGSTHQIGTDGVEKVTTRDGATLHMADGGVPERITQRNGDYRVIHRDGDKVTGFTDYSRDGSEKRAVKDIAGMSIGANGDIKYQDQNGNVVIEKSNFNRVEHNDKGQVTKVIRPDGSYRQMFYDEQTGELSKMADVTFTSKGARSDEWTRKRDASGQFTDTFERIRPQDGRVLEARHNVRPDASGDYKYTDAKGRERESRVADRFRREGDAISSATVEEAHYNFIDEMRVHMPDEARLDRLEQMMTGFEKRMSDQIELKVAAGMSEDQAREEIETKTAATFDHLTRMVQFDGAGALDDKATRVMLAETFMYHAWEPESVNQSGWGSCWLQSGYVPCGLGKHTDTMAKVLADVSTTGKYTDLKGNQYEFSRDQLGIHDRRDGAGWSINNATDDRSQPSPVAHRLDRTLSVMDRGAGYRNAGNWQRIRFGGGGQREIMRRVTGDEMLYLGSGYPRSRQERIDLLNATGAQRNGGPNHVATVALRKIGDAWALVRGDQYDKRDRVVSVIRDLNKWVQTGETARIDRHFNPEFGTQYNIADAVSPSQFKPNNDHRFRDPDNDNRPRPRPILAFLRRRRR